MIMSKQQTLSESIRDNYPATDYSFKKRKPIFGFGINDADYITQPTVEGRQIADPAYIAWKGVLNRVYDKKRKSKHRSYIGVKLCKQWHSFMEFRRWWMDNHVDGWELDKDLLFFGNDTYSPRRCVYVPQWINCVLNTQDFQRGDLMLGVSMEDGRFRASCRGDGSKHIFLGYHNTEEGAHMAWVEFKLSVIEKRKDEIISIDARIYETLKKKILCSK